MRTCTTLLSLTWLLAAGAPDPRRAGPESFERALRENIEPEEVCFHLGHLKLFNANALWPEGSPASGEFQAVEEEHLALLEEMGWTGLLEPTRRTGCEVLATLRPGKVIGVDGLPESFGSEARVVRFEMNAEWQPWTRAPEAEILFDFPTPPTEGERGASGASTPRATPAASSAAARPSGPIHPGAHGPWSPRPTAAEPSPARRSGSADGSPSRSAEALPDRDRDLAPGSEGETPRLTRTGEGDLACSPKAVPSATDTDSRRCDIRLRHSPGT